MALYVYTALSLGGWLVNQMVFISVLQGISDWLVKTNMMPKISILWWMDDYM